MNECSPTPARAGTRKKGADPLTLPLPPSPPPSPSKRRSAECHYSDSELSSPSKKRAPSRLQRLDFEGRGVLFTDLSNARSDAGAGEDLFAEGLGTRGRAQDQSQKEKEEAGRGRPRSRARRHAQVEVVLHQRAKTDTARPRTTKIR